MQVCTKCDGNGSRTVEISTGEKIKKTCYVCKGQGILEGIPGSTVVMNSPKKVPEVPKPAPPVLIKAVKLTQKDIEMIHPPKRYGGLSSPLGDLSWMGSRRVTHG